MIPLDALLTEALPFWEGLTPQEQQLLLDAAVPSTIPKGTITHRADQDCKGIMLVLAGQLRATFSRRRGGRSPSTGCRGATLALCPPPA